MSPYINVKDFSHIMYNNRLYEISQLTSKDLYNMLSKKKITRSHMESVLSKEFDILNHWNDIYVRKIKAFQLKKLLSSTLKYYIILFILDVWLTDGIKHAQQIVNFVEF